LTAADFGALRLRAAAKGGTHQPVATLAACLRVPTEPG
jgi:hypothetical protein